MQHIYMAQNRNNPYTQLPLYQPQNHQTESN